MLTQLSTVKTRLSLVDSTYDEILTNAIAATSAQFDRFCHRTFARMADAREEFKAHETQIRPGVYPIESVTRFELKATEAEGWVQVAPDPEYVVRSQCVISLSQPLGLSREQACMVYTGGYVLPGSEPEEGQTMLPVDLEQACVEQVAFWYQNRTNVTPLYTIEVAGVEQRVAPAALLPGVMATLNLYKRWIN